MYQGSCLCGEVKIEVGQISSIIHCHCSLCRKSSGTAFATNGFVNASEFKITAGAENISFYEMKPGRKRHFCKTCASPIYSSNEADLSRYRLRLGILDSDITEKVMLVKKNGVRLNKNYLVLISEIIFCMITVYTIK